MRAAKPQQEAELPRGAARLHPLGHCACHRQKCALGHITVRGAHVLQLVVTYFLHMGTRLPNAASRVAYM